jgi:hypothetical protein
MIDRTEHLAMEAAISNSLRESVKRLFNAARATAVEVTVQRKDLELLLAAFASRMRRTAP